MSTDDENSRDKGRNAEDATRGTRDAASLAADLSMSGHTLPAGTRLQDYVITGLLGEGGFGIVYLAEDTALQREVALKEYLPSAMASRAKNANTVMVKSASHQETFDLGLKSFVNEARLLARFDHPALVKVHRFWEGNGTAYMVMPYYRGPTLKVVLAGLGHLPGPAEVRRWLWPLMDALAVMHAAHCFHRDIAPDNILITENGPLLLDFGAARRVIGDMTHALTVVLKPGFAPIEQYGEIPGMTQGAWTDIYALASVLYAAISGRRPMPSVERLINDQLQPLATLAAGRFPPQFLQAVGQALALKPADRPQSIEAFRELLDGQGLPLAAASPPARDPAYEKTMLAPPPQAPRPVVTAAPPGATAAAATAAPAPPSAAGKGLPLAAGAVGVLVLAVGGYLLASGSGGRSAPAAVIAPPSAVVAAPPIPTPIAPLTATPIAPPIPTPSAPPTATPTAPTTPAASLPASGGTAFVPAPATVETAPVPPPAPASAPAAAPPGKTAETASERPTEKLPLKAAPARPAVAGTAAEPARVAAPPPAARSAELRSKCSDILQKATLETLSPGEQAFLRKECR